MFNNKNNTLDYIFQKLSRLNMNSIYIKYFIKRLKILLSLQTKTTLINFVTDFISSRSESKLKNTLSNSIGPHILTTKEVNESSLLNSPYSENSINMEKTFSSEDELIIERNIRKFVLDSSKKIFVEWFKERTLNEDDKASGELTLKKSNKKRGRRLKRMDDL